MQNNVVAVALMLGSLSAPWAAEPVPQSKLAFTIGNPAAICLVPAGVLDLSTKKSKIKNSFSLEMEKAIRPSMIISGARYACIGEGDCKDGVFDFIVRDRSNATIKDTCYKNECVALQVVSNELVFSYANPASSGCALLDVTRAPVLYLDNTKRTVSCYWGSTAINDLLAMRPQITTTPLFDTVLSNLANRNPGQVENFYMSNNDTLNKNEFLFQYLGDATFFLNKCHLSILDRLVKDLGGGKAVLDIYGDYAFTTAIAMLKKYWVGAKEKDLDASLRYVAKTIPTVDYAAKVDKYGSFDNSEYEKKWNGVQKFLYRTEKRVPSFKDFLLKKINTYLEKRGG